MGPKIDIHSNNNPIWVYDPETFNFLDVNDAVLQEYGYSRSEFMSLTLKDIQVSEDGCSFTQPDMLKKSSSRNIFSQHRKKNGQIITVRIIANSISLSGRPVVQNEVINVTGYRPEVEDLRRVNRALRTLNACSRVMVRSSDEMELLNEICEVITNEGGYRMAWVGYPLKDESRTVRPVAQAGFEAGYLETIRVSWADVASGRGPTGTAMRTAHPVIVQDMKSDPNIVLWLKESLGRGYASVIGLPLLSGGEVLGALTIFAAEPNAFGTEEVNLLLELADDLAYGVTALRALADREHFQNALSESEERYRSLAEAAHDMIFIIDRDGQIEYINSFTAQLLGHTPAELIASPASAFFPFEMFGHDHDNLDTVIETHQPVYVEEHTTLQGDDVWLGTWLVPLKDGRGEVRAIMGIGRDITNRKQDEEILRQSVERFQSAFDNAFIGMSLVGLDNHFRQVNQALCDILGYTPEKLLASSVDGITYPADRDLEVELQASLLNGKGHRYQVEKRYLHSSGRIIWGQLMVSLVRNSQGSPLYYLGQVEDITERKQAVDALRENEQRYRELFVSATRQAQELSLLDQVRTALARELDLLDLFRTVVEAIVQTFGYTLVSLYMKQGDNLLLQHQVGYKNVVPVIHVSQGVCGRVVHTGQAELLINVRDEPNFIEAIEGIVSEVCVPLFDQGQVVGILNVESTYGMVLTEADLRLMTALSEHIGIAIGRARLFTNLKESGERYALAAQGANDGLWDWNLKGGKIYFSSRWKGILGYDDAEIGDLIDEWFSRVYPEDLELLKLALSAHLQGTSPHLENEYRILHKDGVYRWVLSRGVAVRDEDGIAYRMAGSMTDITERKRAEEQLFYDAFHDGLTGLPNRNLFLDRLEHVIKSFHRYEDHYFAVLFLDMDHFKVVNDSLGHSVGDQMLIAISRRLTTCLRPSDTFARFGGDEFVILLENIPHKNAVIQVAERIQKQLAIPLNMNGQEMVTSASIGIVWSDVTYTRPEEMLRDADIAMYRAKALGKARYQVFDASMRTDIINRLELEADLRHAVEYREFRVHYQPIICVTTAELVGFEALVRWQNPRRGMVYPKDFILAAEESQIIVPIDRWVLHEACTNMRRWSLQHTHSPLLKLNVNMSGRQFTRPDILQHVQEVLQVTGWKAGELRIEITENVIMEDIEFATTMIRQLNEYGIQICIDDFGTGYSSLSYLFQLPVNTLKIDRSFVSKLSSDENSVEIIRAVVTLAHNLGMDVVAEGVESLEQWQKLKLTGCDYAQGNLISVPLDQEEVEAKIFGNEPLKFFDLPAN